MSAAAPARSLLEAGTASNTDKITHHGYARFLQPHVDALRTAHPAGGALLEIGIEKGSSLPMWAAALPGWSVWGLDIKLAHEGPGVRVLKGDQSKPEDLRATAAAIAAAGRPLLLVNDDGSHIPEHQALSFDVLFGALAPGGVYMVEDVETSYWTRGELYGYPTRYGYLHPANVVERFKAIADVVHWEFLLPDARAALTATAERHGFSRATLAQIGTILFAPNCVIVTKKGPADAPYDGRPYRFRHLFQ
jgi:hypothetical protein